MTRQTPTPPIFDLVTELEDTIGKLHRYVHLAYVAINDPVARGTVIDMSHELVAPVDQLMRDFDRLWDATKDGAGLTAPEPTSPAPVPIAPTAAPAISADEITTWRTFSIFANSPDATSDEAEERCNALAAFEQTLLARPCRSIRDLAVKLEIAGFCDDVLPYEGTQTARIAAEVRDLIDSPTPADLAPAAAA